VNDKQRFQLAAVESLAGGRDAPLVAAAAHALAPSVDPQTVVLVEGSSDQAALQALAARRGRDLAAEGIAVVPMGGARNLRHFLELFGPRGLDLRLAGLCDAREEADFRRGLERAGLGSNLRRADMEALGFYVCVADLEDELIRCLGAARVEQVVEAQGELGSFRTSSSSLPGKDDAARRSFGASSAPTAAGRSDTRGCWSTRWSSRACLGR
jgi:hypothetical protein